MAKKSVSPKKLSNQGYIEVTKLPFVKKGQKGNCLWSVEPTGNYTEDCLTGSRYAALALEYMKGKDRGHLLNECVKGMIRKGEISGIEVGFLTFMGEAACFCSNIEIYQLLGQHEFFNQILKSGMLQNVIDNSVKTE
jgi:hypothetical protein